MVKKKRSTECPTI